jgi:hypothetical protein
MGDDLSRRERDRETAILLRHCEIFPLQVCMHFSAENLMQSIVLLINIPFITTRFTS